MGILLSGWYSDEACTKEFDFAKPLLEDVTIYTKWKKVIDPMEKEDQTTSINSVKTGDNFAIQGYVLGLIGVMAAIVMMQKNIINKDIMYIIDYLIKKLSSLKFIKLNTSSSRC